MADDITRKEFLQAGVATLVAATIGACASDDAEDGGDAGDDGGDCTGGASANIANNHGHTLSVSAGDINEAMAKDYDIQGTADHSHTVSLSADDMMMIASGENVAVTSSSGGAAPHTHAVTVSC